MGFAFPSFHLRRVVYYRGNGAKEARMAHNHKTAAAVAAPAI